MGEIVVEYGGVGVVTVSRAPAATDGGVVGAARAGARVLRVRGLAGRTMGPMCLFFGVVTINPALELVEPAVDFSLSLKEALLDVVLDDGEVVFTISLAFLKL